MPTNFERVKLILDLICADIDKPAGSAQLKVLSMISRLSNDYPSIWNGAINPVDYSTPECHAAYAYTYMAANADLIYSILQTSDEFSKHTVGQEHLSVACIGGGPGTELLGLYKFIERLGLRTKAIECRVFDHNAPWSAVWPAVKSVAPSGVSTAVEHRALQLTEPNSITDLDFVSSADVITFSYCLSEAWRYDTHGGVSATVARVLDTVKAGALVLYSDNAGDHFDPHLERVFCQRPDLEIVARESKSHMLVGSDEESSVLAEYTKWLNGWRSKLTGQATLVAFRKL